MSQNQSTQHSYVSPGMPPLKLGKTTSFFEFWPTWLMYIPVVLQWLLLSVKHKSLTLPLIANPQLPLSGMVGIPKSQLLAQAQDELKSTILPWLLFERTNADAQSDVNALVIQIQQAGYSFPLVCKPDIGCRGVGVKLIHTPEKLLEAVKRYPCGASIMIQKLSDYEPEAGIFYVRHPNSQQGQIISMALKYMPYVIGDGAKTLGELIEADERASDLKHLYQSRHQQNWQTVIEKNTPYRLVFSASHSKGAIFKDAKTLITPELTQKLNTLMQQLPEFHYGRLDVKFKDVDSLTRGEDLQIVEINTASSESLHIWDSNTSFREAVRSLLFQYRTLFTMGAANRIKGHRPPGFRKLLKHWRLERQLTQFYPETD
jgi:hypothetical protein